jgi:hypothetical protein
MITKKDKLIGLTGMSDVVLIHSNDRWTGYLSWPSDSVFQLKTINNNYKFSLDMVEEIDGVRKVVYLTQPPAKL